MSQKKKTIEEAAQHIDAGLGGLFGALNEAIGEMMTRLDDGTSGTVARDHTFQTDKGPVRAQAGIQLRMGGMEVGAGGSDPQPINPNRTTSTAPAPAEQTPPLRDLSYDLIAEDEVWVLTADVPGVARKDVALSQDGTVLKIKTTGRRRYAGDADLEGDFALDTIKTSIRNGILTLQIPRGGAA